jgi:hypothetical protein
VKLTPLLSIGGACWAPYSLKAQAPLDNAVNAFFETQERAQAAYRKSVATALEKADTVEIFLLDFETVKEPSADSMFWDTRLPKDFLAITPYKSKSRILQRKVLTLAEKDRPGPTAAGALNFEYGGGGFCHYPIHGIRFSIGNEILFQTSLCWLCTNFSVTYPDGGGFVFITVPELKELCHELMPIPEKEIERFQLARFWY